VASGSAAVIPAPTTSQPFLGAHIDWATDTPAAYSERLTYTPVVVGDFADFPFEPEQLGYINDRVPLLAAQGSSLMLTLMPHGGLASVDATARTLLTERLTAWNNLGVPVVVRYAHEMNGSWYAWGQKPAAFIASFRLVADAVRAAPNSTILWNPNEASGYPYNGGSNSPTPGSADFIALDTNADEALTAADDPYAPFWPGAAYVDSVGLSLYFYGIWYPWDANDIAEPDTVAGMIDGTFHGAAMPDFYATYAAAYTKPFVVAETGTLFNVDTVGGNAELAVKQAWWSQLFEVAPTLPLLAYVCWFEYEKVEGGLGAGGGDEGTVDWRVLATPAVRTAFLADLDAFLGT
jgi:hypothetical protein